MKMIRNSFFYFAPSLFVCLFQDICALPQVIFGVKLSIRLNRYAVHTNGVVNINKLMDFTSCVHECSTDSNCLATNYRTRVKLCQMTFYKGLKRDVLYKDKMYPGFVIWRKDLDIQVSSTTNEKEKATYQYCKVPTIFGDIPIYGNMFTSGSKQAYGCYDHSRQTEYRHVMVCRDDDWSNMVDVCGFGKPQTFRGKQHSYKSVSSLVTRESALESCKKDNGGLIKIHDDDKRHFLETNYAVIKDSWVDAVRRGYRDWVTSDGEQVDYRIFHTTVKFFINSFVPDDCATTDEEWQLQATDCSEHRSYICEMVF